MLRGCFFLCLWILVEQIGGSSSEHMSFQGRDTNGKQGRLIDHLKRDSLNINTIQTVALDEADEMLKMGFIEYIKCILQEIPSEHQIALFFIIMPQAYSKHFSLYLKNTKGYY